MNTKGFVHLQSMEDETSRMCFKEGRNGVLSLIDSDLIDNTTETVICPVCKQQYIVQIIRPILLDFFGPANLIPKGEL